MFYYRARDNRLASLGREEGGVWPSKVRSPSLDLPRDDLHIDLRSSHSWLSCSPYFAFIHIRFSCSVTLLSHFLTFLSICFGLTWWTFTCSVYVQCSIEKLPQDRQRSIARTICTNFKRWKES